MEFLEINQYVIITLLLDIYLASGYSFYQCLLNELCVMQKWNQCCHFTTLLN